MWKMVVEVDALITEDGALLRSSEDGLFAA